MAYEYYEGNWSRLPDFDALTPVKTGFTNHFDIGVRDRNDAFAIRFHGAIMLPTNNVFTYYTSSDDGSRLYIDDHLIVDNDGLHGALERLGFMNMTTGLHDIVVTYFDGADSDSLVVSWEGPGISKAVIPDGVLYRYGTLTDWDGDKDGMPDNWEICHFGNTVDSDGTEDADRDGMTDREEYLAGTDPLAPDSLLVMSEADMTTINGTFTLCWPSVAGKTYGLRHGTNLTMGLSLWVGSNLAATPPMNTFTGILDSVAGFYRVFIETQ
jgi:hypothetical protein